MAISILIQADAVAPEDNEVPWGLVGVRPTGATVSMLYPIGQTQADRFIQQTAGRSPWIVLTTLNNRALMIRTDAMPRLTITDNDDPEDFYGDTAPVAGAGWNPLDYAAGYARLDGEGDAGDDVFRLLRMTRVHYRDGSTDELPLDAEGSWAAFNAVQHDPDELLHLACRERGIDVFVPPGQVAVIDMPLYPMRRAAQEQFAQYVSEAEAKAVIGEAQAQSSQRRRPARGGSAGPAA